MGFPSSYFFIIFLYIQYVLYLRKSEKLICVFSVDQCKKYVTSNSHTHMYCTYSIKTSIIIWCIEIFFFCDFCYFVHHQTADRPRLSHSKHTMMCGYRLCWHKTFSLDYIIEKRLCSRYLIQNIRRRRHTKNGLCVTNSYYLPSKPFFPNMTRFIPSCLNL